MQLPLLSNYTLGDGLSGKEKGGEVEPLYSSTSKNSIWRSMHSGDAVNKAKEKEAPRAPYGAPAPPPGLGPQAPPSCRASDCDELPLEVQAGLTAPTPVWGGGAFCFIFPFNRSYCACANTDTHTRIFNLFKLRWWTLFTMNLKYYIKGFLFQSQLVYGIIKLKL